MTEEVIRDREELSGEQIRSLVELKEMAASYGFRYLQACHGTKQAIQWLYFAFLAAPRSRMERNEPWEGLHLPGHLQRA